MPEPDHVRKGFLDTLRQVAELLEVSPSDITAGIGAVEDIFDQVVGPLAFAPVLNPYFAGHDLNHPVRLASKTKEFLTQNLPQKDSPLCQMDCLVLLFSALLLHDLGMAILTAELTDIEWDEIWHGHLIRPKHDERSLLFIENQLLTLTSELSRWMAFWEGQQDTPRPVQRFTLLLLARICQSHGDPVEHWLQFTSLDQYSSPSGGGVTDFRETWGVEAWDKMRRTALGAATLLSFIDLCDIGPQRFPLPGDNELISRILPQREDLKRTAFLHWIGHRIGQVKFSDGETKYVISSSFTYRLRTLIPLNWGPGADLLEWGNNPVLLDALSEFARISMRRVMYYEAAVDEDAWKEIELQAENFFLNCWPFAEVNRHLCSASRTTLDAVVVAPRWWLASATSLHRDLPEEDFFPLHFLLSLRHEGLLIEDCISFNGYAISPNVPTVLCSPAEEPPLFAWHVGDSFTASLKLAREWMTSRRDLKTIRLAIKGNSVHRDLRVGNLNSYASTIFIVPILFRNKTSFLEYIQIAQHVARLNRSDIRVVFCGAGQPFAEELLRADVSLLEYRVDDAGLSALRQFAFSESGKAAPPISSEPLAGADYPTQLALSLYCWRKGSSFFAESIPDLLDTTDDIRQAFGLILLLSLFEFLDFTGEGVEEASVIDRYKEMAGELIGRVALPEPRSLFPVIESTKLLEVREGRIRAKESGDAIGVVLAQIATKSMTAFCLQFAILCRLRLWSPVYNVLSPLFREVFTVLFDARMAEIVFDESLPVSLRARIGLGLAERISEKPALMEANALDLLRTIASRVEHLGDKVGDFVAFQMAYRLGRGLWLQPGPKNTFREAIRLESHVVSLGLLEAIASESASQSGGYASTPSDVELTKEVVEHLLSASRSATGEDALIMAYDIVWHYGAKNGFLPGAANLVEYGKLAGWDKVAPYFHEEGVVEPSAQGELVARWKRIRGLFLEVLEATPPTMRRERVSLIIKQRVLDQGENNEPTVDNEKNS